MCAHIYVCMCVCACARAPLLQNYIRTCTPVQGEWLLELAPHYYELSSFPKCEAKNSLERVAMRKTLMAGGRRHR